MWRDLEPFNFDELDYIVIADFLQLSLFTIINPMLTLGTIFLGPYDLLQVILES